MKWTIPGHEYDEVFNEIIKRRSFYLFGGGDYGRQFLHIFEKEIEIKGYIDNDIKKQGKEIDGYFCYSLGQVCLSKEEGIILTMSQIARVQPIEQLTKLGYKKNVDFYVIEEFLSVYYVYKYDKVYFSSISFLPSTVCNLQCRYCLNFNPFAKKFYVREWKHLISDVDLFFSCVDYIMLFHVSGGEPFLYKHTVDLIEYIDKKYGNRIDTLRLVTNGTVIPPDQCFERLSKCKLEITVDDYREAVPQYNDKFGELILKLKKYNIKYYINKADFWIDLAPEKTNYSHLSDEELIQHRTECNQSWQELRDGKLYNCNYAAYATVAGISGKEDYEETYELNSFSQNNKKELVEFRLGYTIKGYTNFCMRCKGFTTGNLTKVKPALQI